MSKYSQWIWEVEITYLLRSNRFKILVLVNLYWFKTFESASTEISSPAYSTTYTLLWAKGPYSINARQLHADVDDHHTEHLPANSVIQQELPHRQCLQRRQGTLLLLHLLDLCLDVTLGSVPLQRWGTGQEVVWLQHSVGRCMSESLHPCRFIFLIPSNKRKEL